MFSARMLVVVDLFSQMIFRPQIFLSIQEPLVFKGVGEWQRTGLRMMYKGAIYTQDSFCFGRSCPIVDLLTFSTVRNNVYFWKGSGRMFLNIYRFCCSHPWWHDCWGASF